MGVKQIETRSWSTAYSGPLLTHPTKGKEEEKFLPMSRHLKNTYLILNNCLSVTSTDVIRIGTGALFLIQAMK